MTLVLPAIDMANDNWVDLFAKANNIIDEMASRVVTTVDPTAGDVKIVGTVSANMMYTSQLSGGYLGTANTIVISSNVVITDQNISVPTVTMNGVTMTANSSTVITQAVKNTLLGSSLTVSNTVSVSGSTPTIVHQFPKANYRSGKYTFAITSGSNRSTCEILMVNDGANAAQVTEYAILHSNNALGTFSANNTATDTRIYFNPHQTNNTVSFHAVLVT